MNETKYKIIEVKKNIMSEITDLKIPYIYSKLLKELSELLLQKDQMKLSSNSLNARVNELRNALKPFLLSREDHTFKLDNLRAVLKQDHLKRTFRRDETLAFICENFGEEIAKIVDENCTILSSNDSVYLYRTKSQNLSESEDERAFSNNL